MDDGNGDRVVCTRLQWFRDDAPNPYMWEELSEDHRKHQVATAREVLEWLDTERRIWIDRYIDAALAREREDTTE